MKPRSKNKVDLRVRRAGSENDGSFPVTLGVLEGLDIGGGAGGEQGRGKFEGEGMGGVLHEAFGRGRKGREGNPGGCSSHGGGIETKGRLGSSCCYEEGRVVVVVVAVVAVAVAVVAVVAEVVVEEKYYLMAEAELEHQD